jgi:dienelactone hydrolase
LFRSPGIFLSRREDKTALQVDRRWKRWSDFIKQKLGDCLDLAATARAVAAADAQDNARSLQLPILAIGKGVAMFLANGARVATAALSIAMVSTSAVAQFIQEHIITVESSTPASVKDFLQGKKGPPVQLAGKLHLAKPGDKQPVVLILPGAGGIGATRHAPGEWARVLNEAGISTFILDSFTGRKRYQIGEQAALPAIVRVVDAFAALRMLSEHPFVDGSKISVMGFSHGSAATMYTNMARFQEQYGNGLKFASHISLYGLCATKYRGDDEIKSPMLILHGSADDWVPAAPCIEYVERLQKAGKEVRLITYPDAHHVFDSVSAGALKKLDFTTAAGCLQEEAGSGEVVGRGTDKPVASDDPCRKKGVSFGYNENATKKAHEDVLAFLKKEILK